MLTPFPGTVDFAAWEKTMEGDPTRIDGIPLTRHWLIPKGKQPKVYVPHPMMSADDIRSRTQGVWDQFYSWRNVWARAKCVESVKSRIAFVLVSKLYRQMYANTGNRHRQRADQPVRDLGSSDREAAAAALRRQADAGTAGTAYDRRGSERRSLAAARSYARGQHRRAPAALGAAHRVGGATVLEDRRVGRRARGVAARAGMRLGWDATVVLPR